MHAFRSCKCCILNSAVQVPTYTLVCRQFIRPTCPWWVGSFGFDLIPILWCVVICVAGRFVDCLVHRVGWDVRCKLWLLLGSGVWFPDSYSSPGGPLCKHSMARHYQVLYTCTQFMGFFYFMFLPIELFAHGSHWMATERYVGSGRVALLFCGWTVCVVM